VLHIKKNSESQFLYEATSATDMKIVYEEVTAIYNGRLKIQHLCYGESTDQSVCERRFLNSSIFIAKPPRFGIFRFLLLTKLNMRDQEMCFA